MSRYYEMAVEIGGYEPARAEVIQAAAQAVWPFSDWWLAGDGGPGETMRASAQHNLPSHQGEAAFAARLTLAIWQANTKFCRVTVEATDLEHRPIESYELEEADYARLIQSEPLAPTQEDRVDDDRCECEGPGFFHSGVPGIVAHLEDGHLADDAGVNRCDLCRRYPFDEAARERLRELGYGPSQTPSRG